MSTFGARGPVILATVVSGALALALSAALLTRVDDIDDSAMSTAGPGARAMAVPLLETAGPAPPIYVLPLSVDDSTGLLAYQELRILFTTGGNVQLLGGAVEIVGVACDFETPAGARIVDNEMLRFVRSPGCRAAGTPSGDLKLTVRLAERAAIGVWTWTSDARAAEPASPVIRVVSIPGYTGPTPLLRGRLVREASASHLRRIDLLNHVWQIDRSAKWLWLALAAAVAAIGAGTWLLSNLVASGGSAPRPVGHAAIAMWFLAAGIGTAYAVLTPPFEVADEPDHLLSYARMTGNAQLAAQAADLARLGHLERIKFHGEERFRPIDVGRPFAVPWNEETFAENVLARSSTTAWWWQLLAALPYAGGASEQIRRIRLANVMLFALSVAAATTLLHLTAADDVTFRPALYGAFILLPILPFFAMAVSEFAVLCAIYVLVAGCAVALAGDGGRGYWLGAPLGLIAATMTASGRSALPMLPTIGALLLGRVTLGEPTLQLASWRRSVIFWVGLGISFSAVTVVLNVDYPPPVDVIPPIARETLLPALRWVWSRSWIFGTLALLGLLMEQIVAQVRRRTPAGAANRLRGLARWGCYAVAVGIALSFALSTVIDYPHLEMIGPNPPMSAAQYAEDVLAVLFTTFRLSTPDLLMVTSFVGGFGWVDTLPDRRFVTLLVTLCGIAYMGLAVLLARRRDVRRTAWIVIIAAGWTASLVVYAIATHGMGRNLHGRYLVGAYVCAIAIASTSLARAGFGARERFGIPITATLLLGAVALHGYCLSVILARYF